ncbi:MAG: EamA family transporter [Candidatus Nanopelagicales bacterium]
MVSRSWLINYVILAAIWGFSFAFVKQGLTALTPLQVTAARMALGALTICLFLVASGRWPRPTSGEWWRIIVLGTVGLALPFTCIAFAETRITSVLAGLLNAATPLFAALFVSWFIPRERPDRMQVGGLLIGFVGMVVLIGVWQLSTAGVDPAGVAAMIVATVCYGFGTAFARVALTTSNLVGSQLTGMQLLSGTVLLSLLLIVDPGDPPGPMSATAAISVLGLGILGTGVAMAMFWQVLREAGATVAATVTYVVPLVSTTVGVVLLHEHLRWNELVGGVVVIAGVLLTQWPQLSGRGVEAVAEAPVTDD